MAWMSSAEGMTSASLSSVALIRNHHAHRFSDLCLVEAEDFLADSNSGVCRIEPTHRPGIVSNYAGRVADEVLVRCVR